MMARLGVAFGWLFAFAFVGVAALSGEAAAQSSRGSAVALVVGNWDYDNVQSLRNPEKDAQAVAASFEALGFEVQTALNLSASELDEVLVEFRDRAEMADTAVFYYAGHGTEIDGQNYLIPVDARLKRGDDATFEAVTLDKAMTAAARARSLSVVLVDACRNNIFGDNDLTRSAASGFVSEQPRNRQIITFSTAPGTVAYDGEGDFSPFAQALVELLPKARDYDVRQVFGGLGERVRELTEFKQSPYFQAVGFGVDTVMLVNPERSFAATPRAAEPAMSVELRPFDGGRMLRPELPDEGAAPSASSTVASIPPAPATDAAAPTGSFEVAAAPRAGMSADAVLAGLAAPNDVAALPALPSLSDAPIYSRPAALDPSTLGDLETFKECASCPEMTVIPAGAFEMGSPSFSFANFNEAPQRDVAVARFAIARFETTFEQWDACIADGYCQAGRVNDYGWGRGDLPVLRASYQDVTGARGFVAWLNSKVDGAPYRLPSEAEWEYAAAAGSDDSFAFGDYLTAELARYDGLSTRSAAPARTARVGSFPANDWGLHDLHGNVAEWVADCWHDDYSDAPETAEPWMADRCKKVVVRGGSWSDKESALRVQSREMQSRLARSNRIGFRVARSLR